MAEPRDVSQPVGIRQRDVERHGDIQRMGPVLGKARRRERAGLEGSVGPRVTRVGVGRPIRVTGVRQQPDHLDTGDARDRKRELGGRLAGSAAHAMQPRVDLGEHRDVGTALHAQAAEALGDLDGVE